MLSYCSSNDLPVFSKIVSWPVKKIFFPVNLMTSPAIGMFGKSLVLGPGYNYSHFLLCL